MKYLEQRVPVNVVWANNTLTCTSSTAHFLSTGDAPRLSIDNYGEKTLAVVVLTNVTFDIVGYPKISTPAKGVLILPFFSAGQTGRYSFKLPERSSFTSVIVQSYVEGTGGAIYKIELSLDGQHWVTGAQITHPIDTSGDSDFQAIEPSWEYFAVNITSIGAASKLVVMYNSGGNNV